jgi:hypothetical protein
MVDKKSPHWPKWQESATKGDVISALVSVRACLIDVLIALSASRRGDDAKAFEAIASLNQNDDQLNELIKKLGGTSDD